jgi:hypothetical protein
MSGARVGVVDWDSGVEQGEGTRHTENWATGRAVSTRRHRVTRTCSLLRCVFLLTSLFLLSNLLIYSCLLTSLSIPPLSPLAQTNRATSSNPPPTGSPKPSSPSTTRTTSCAGCAPSRSLLSSSALPTLSLRSIYIIPVLALLWIPAIVQLTSKGGASVWGVKLIWWSIWLTVVWCGWWGAALGALTFLPFSSIPSSRSSAADSSQ